MLPQTNSLVELRILGLHRHAHLWKTERTDGTFFYFTDHNYRISFQGNDYVPVGGFSGTAIRAETGFKDSSVDVRGPISASAVTYDDLRVGLWGAAKITEYLVDWRYPFRGAFTEKVFFVGSPRFNEESWNFEITGLTSLLQRERGRVFSRNCDADLGDARCGVDLGPLTESGTVSSVDTQRLKITTSNLALPVAGDGVYDFGRFTFTSGGNIGLKVSVKIHLVDGADQTFEFFLKTSFDLQAGDGFDVTPGCAKTATVCIDKFNNIVNHRGHPTIPGTDKSLSTPG